MSVSGEQIKTACADNYAIFAQVMQDDGWFDPVHKRLCESIQEWIGQDIAQNKDVQILIIMPRGSLKTTMVTKYLPVWCTLPSEKPELSWKGPNLRFLVATNTLPNARKKLQDIRGLYDSHTIFRAIWPEYLPTTQCRWNDDVAEINRPQKFPEGTFEGKGVGGKTAGTHYNCILEDDTTEPDESDIDEGMATPGAELLSKAIGWHQISTALLVPKGIRFRIVVTTRWADNDLVNHIQTKEQGKWHVFDMPAMDETGNPNFSMFYTREKLAEIEHSIGPYMFSCLYMNRPIDASLRKFKDEWLKTCPESEIPEDGYYSIAIDPAISEKKEACESAITRVFHHVAENKHPHMYFDRDIHGHMNPYDVAAKALDLAEEDIERTKCILVETVAYQTALKFILWDEMTRRRINIGIVEVRSRQQKNARIEALVPYFALNRIHLCPTLTPQTESQFRQFPHGKLVDIIDSFSMHMQIVKREKNPQISLPQRQPNPLSWDSVMDELAQKAKLRRYGEGLNSRIDPMSGMSTGLGIHFDAERLNETGRN